MTCTALVRLAPAVALALGLAAAAPALAAQAREGRSGSTPDAADLDEDGQASRLPSLPGGMTLDMIRRGDELFRTKGGCTTCHGPDGGGMPALGSGITAGLHFIPAEWGAIDTLITQGLPEPATRSPVLMPPRGVSSDLTAEETRSIAAYVWAISQVKGEPWPGGHRVHQPAEGQEQARGDSAAARQGR